MSIAAAASNQMQERCQSELLKGRTLRMLRGIEMERLVKGGSKEFGRVESMPRILF